jgi:putative membrane protein
VGLLFLCAALAVPPSHAHVSLREVPADAPWNEITVIAAILLAAVLYGAGLRRVWRRSTHAHRGAVLRAVAFVSGLAAVSAALLSPLDRWGAQLFALHMIQHETLMLIAAPLLVWGRPLPLFLWAFGDRSRAGLARFVQAAPVRAIWAGLLTPLVAWLLHALVLWIWHVPRFFDAVLRNAALHEFQHLSFLAAALVFWAAMLEARRQEQRGAAILYLFTTTVHTSVLGALITFAVRPWYAAYLQTPGHWGLSALEDQQLGGLIMWVPGSLVYVGIALALLVRWIRSSDSSVSEPLRPQV